MNRNTASQLLRDKLNQYGLKDWGVRLNTKTDAPYVGLCSYKDKCIILNAHHIDIHPDAEVINTILHEVAHAIVGPFHAHDITWSDKAREIGCDNTSPICSMSMPAALIDAIRSGATIEVEVEEQIVRTPKYKVTRLQDRCPECNKVAIEKFKINTHDRDGNDVILITLDCFHIIKKVIPRGTPFESLVSNWWKPEVKSCKHEWNKIQCKKCGEFRLYNFQVTGAKFAEAAIATNKGVGIFDDMGLGKTVQVLALILFHHERNPTLYVVKSAIKFQWFKQIIRWLGPDYAPQVIATGKDYVFPGLKSYIISYDLLRRFPREKLQALGIKTVVLDECQQIKNPDSTRTQEVRRLVANENVKVIPLSGTPWKNRGEELFPVMNMLDPRKFYSHQAFLDTWVDYYWQGNKKKMGGIRRPEKFKEFIQDIVIRREYNEVMDEYPEINRTKLSMQLDELTQNEYDDATSEFVNWYNQYVINGTEEQINGMEILAKLSRMRHITGLAKVPATVAFAEEFAEDTDRKLVIFVHHIDVGHVLWTELQDKFGSEFPVLHYTSDKSDEERFRIQEEFNSVPRAFMIASTQACGEGVDLQTCADAIMHERQWNPQNEDQAAPGRFRRIGQLSKTINITFPEGEGTVDEHLDSIVERKRLQFHAAMNKGEMIAWSQNDIAKELATTIIEKFRQKNKGKEKKTNITGMAAMR